MSPQLIEFLKLGNIIHENRIKYVVLRLPADVDADSELEVDVLVREDQIKELSNVLENMGFSRFVDERTSNDTRTIPHAHFRKDKLHLDICSSLSYGKRRNIFASDGTAVVDRGALSSKGYHTPAQEDEMVMLLLHCLADTRDFTKYGDKLISLATDIGEERCVKTLSSVLK